ncbi:MAG: YbbR family protein [candidate division CPR2 bacterium GW2011_GWC1_39_9]|uniref:YbbR family protein n=1 Tax=candidate division CPR2 bacterium GW2011_GWC2_39_10 TaxID=1618345 RepID=A0A0G0LUE9_UNCC2|nr:MAG: YbbR family protein [candidate division CPR2 bacterium GW2011_GWC2_39_10]KKR33777.1 MAG: YbbR family protein [candidate division CPR2 bacterium GW2011_GWC1_39_9]
MKYITNNFFVKFLCLVLAFVFWVFVMAADTRMGYFPKEIEVKVRNIANGLAVVEDTVPIKIKVKAPLTVYNKLNDKSFEAYVDASSIKEAGAENLDIKIDSKEAGVQVVGSDPKSFLLKLEDEETKKMAITLSHKGKPSDDYKVGTGEISTKDVIVTGSPTKLKKIADVVALIELKGNEKGNIDADMPVVALDEDNNTINYLVFDPEIVGVKMAIIPKVVSKSVGIKVNLTGEAAKGYWVSKIKTDPEIVAVKGELEKIKNMEYVETEKIDLVGNSQTMIARAKFQLPEGVKVADNIDKVNVQIFISKIDATKTISPAVNFKRGNPKYKAETLNMPAVTLSGSQAALNAATSENVVLNIDLSSYGPGEQKIQIKKEMVTVSGEVEVTKVLPEFITIKITEIATPTP